MHYVSNDSIYDVGPIPKLESTLYHNTPVSLNATLLLIQTENISFLWNTDGIPA